MPKKPAARKTAIYLIRHGQTKENAIGRIQGQRMHGELSEEGKKQAEKVRKWAESKEISFVYHSPLGRAVQTARIAFPSAQMAQDRALLEVDYGRMSNKTHEEAIREIIGSSLLSQAECEELVAKHGRIVFSHFAGKLEGEPIERAYARGIAFLRKIAKKHSGETIAVVTHGAFMMILACGLLGLPFNQESFHKVTAPNCAVTKITVEGEKITVESVNDTGHLK